MALRLFIPLFIFLVSSFSVSYAQTISPSQLSQLQNLTPAQQQALAKQLGVDVSQFTKGQSQTTNQYQSDPSGIYPRGTQFDEQGNPVSFVSSGEVTDPIDDFLNVEEVDLKPFGYDIFANAPSTYSPVYDTPVPADYLLGPGDGLHLNFYGKENNHYEITVDREGIVSIPGLGPIVVNGLTFAEAKQLIVDNVKQQIIGAQASVSMGQLRSIRVFVLGEAYKPGAYTISSLSTITHALVVSGGVNDIASLRNIQLKRSGKVVETLDLYDLLIRGDNSNDKILQAGDVVFIPPVRKTVTVSGLVRRPAIYEIKREKTIADAVSLAGGSLPDGYTQEVNVTRVTQQGKTQLTVNLSNVDSLSNGDEIVVSKISEYIDESITLIGAVSRPGKYQWKSGYSIRTFLSSKRADLLPEADLEYGLVVREDEISSNINVFQFDLKSIYAGVENDIQLEKNDRILVFSKQEKTSLTDFNLDELAFSHEDLENKQKLRLQRLIQEKLFWEQLGVDTFEDESLFEQEESRALEQSIIALSDEEQAQLIEYRDATDYSRTRLLTPLVERLREQSRSGAPIQLVEIAGSVKYPGVYPLPVDGTAKQIIKAAGGLTESAYAEKSEITQIVLDESGKAVVKHVDFSPARVMDGKEVLYLSSRDRINIFNVPDWQEELTVTLKGEFVFPGEYTIRRGESLSSLIQRAGGFTDYADPSASIFTREELKKREQANIRKLAEDLRREVASQSLRNNKQAGALVSYGDARVLLRDLTQVQAIGRLVINLPGIVTGESKYDINLQDGDELIVPSLNKTINVVGEVYQPTSHVFSDDLTYLDFIQASGGFKALADEEKVYIIRANGSVVVPSNRSARGYWFSRNNASQYDIQAGDTIVVPFDSNHVDNITLWTNVSQVLYQFAVTIAAIGSL